MRESPLIEWLLTLAHWSRRTPCGTPLNRRLFDDLREAILSGRIGPGARLPASRDLARELHVARNTVIYAYDRLTAEGYARASGGSGTYVSDTAPDASLIDRMAGTSRTTNDWIARQGSRLAARAMDLLVNAGASDYQVGAFVPGIPDIGEFPRVVWQRLIAKVWRTAGQGQLGYGSRHGYPPLKRALAEYLTLARGVACSPEQIIVTQGSHQAIDLCARLLADPGELVWIEDPCYWGARSVFRGAGLDLEAIPVDAQGIQLPSAFGRSPRLIFVTPSHQYPSGVVMSLARRRLLTEMARAQGAWIIEDDYDSEFRYYGAPLPSLQGLDPHRNTIYIGSFSKVLYPGLRLAFLIVPPDLVDAFAVAQSEVYRGGQLTIQAALAEFIDNGHYSAHVRRMRKIYAARNTLLTTSLRRHLGDRIDVAGTDTGLHLTVALHGANDHLVSQGALAQGIVARPLSSYFAVPSNARNGLVLGYGGVSDDAIEGAVQKLAIAIDAAETKGRCSRETIPT
nr:PLP-dependent aminotransferase family protein [Burkholderia ambifaria]